MGMNWLGMARVSSRLVSVHKIIACTAAGLPKPDSALESKG